MSISGAGGGTPERAELHCGSGESIVSPGSRDPGAQDLDLGCLNFPGETRFMEAHTIVRSGGAAQGPGSWILILRFGPGVASQFVFSAHAPKPGSWILGVDLKVMPLLYCIRALVSCISCAASLCSGWSGLGWAGLAGCG